jgi:DNA-binding MarR family transcriptional regulator
LKHLSDRRIVVPVSGVREERAAEAWQLMRALLLDRKEQFPAIAASLGLNPGALHALMSLDEGEPQSMSALAGAWKCDASNVTWLVDRLEERGLAERRAHPTDRRIRTVVMTRRGAKVRAQVHAQLSKAPAAFDKLTVSDLDGLVRVLKKIVPTADASDRSVVTR